MGAAVESFLTLALPVALIVAAGATIFRQPLARIARYLRAWRDKDLIDDAEEARCRAEAEEEVRNRL